MTAPTFTGLTMTATCPTCASALEIINPGASNGYEAKIIVRCPAHRKHGQFLIHARISLLTREPWRAP